MFLRALFTSCELISTKKRRNSYQFFFKFLIQFRLGVIGHVILFGYLTYMINDLRADENAIRGQG